MVDDNLIIFAFSNTVAARVLEGIKHTNKVLLDSRTESIDQFIESASKLKGKRVLGLGQYSGRDKDKLRIELICNNKFRNTHLGLKKLTIAPFIEPLGNSKYARGLGNSYCNLVSVRLINKTNVSYSFIHIPKSIEVSRAVAELTSMLEFAAG